MEKTVWSGNLSASAREGHPHAAKCYAWSFRIEGSTMRDYYAVLNIPPVDSAEKVVRAAIVQDHKTGQIPKPLHR